MGEEPHTAASGLDHNKSGRKLRLKTQLELIDSHCQHDDDTLDNDLPELRDIPSSMTNPSARTPMTRRSNQRTSDRAARPPISEVPPNTTAAIAFNSKLSPVAGCADSSCEAMIIPTKAAQRAEKR